jgi:hypothetical protein
MAKVGTVFQIVPDGGNHFWIVISKEKRGMVLAVNSTDATKCPDSPCKINIGDHPAIIKPSAIIYRYAREFVSSKIDELCAKGSYLRQLDDCSPEVVKRIVAGAKQADDLTLKLLDYLK